VLGQDKPVLVVVAVGPDFVTGVAFFLGQVPFVVIGVIPSGIAQKLIAGTGTTTAAA